MTSKPCTVCQHREVEAIDAQLRLKTSLRKIEALFKVTRASLSRHSKHLKPVSVEIINRQALIAETPEIMAASLELAALRNSDDEPESVLARANYGADSLQEIAMHARKANSLSISIQAWAKHREYLELIGRLTGELEQAQVAVTVNMRDQWGASNVNVLRWAVARHVLRMFSFTPAEIEKLHALALSNCPECNRLGCAHDSL